MVISTFEEWLAALRSSGLLNAAQVEEVARLGRSRRWGEWDELFELLARRRLLSIYAGRKILQGKVEELFFGPYLLLDKLGEGGMGKVYRARRHSDGAILALKVVRSHLLSHPLVRRRYEREVATALSLNHPNIVRVYEAGQHEGRHYLAMEFIDGIDLARLGKEYRPLAIPEACEYVRQTALGLQHAHERGFVHRDIKPSNIIVAGERHLPQAVEPAVAKILDMGLARAVGVAEEGGEPLDLTRDGVVVGTPDYMAPEQAKNSRNVDNRADLYSLGCTFYFLLTGRPPFAEGTAIEKILKHQLDPVPPVRQWRPDVPAAVEEILLHLLAKRPEDRPASALEVAQALEPWCRYPFTLHPASMAVRQSSHSGSTRQMPTPTETEPALQGRTDPQIGPPPPGSDWPNPASGRSPAGVNLPPTAPTPVMVSLPSATSLPTCASDRSNKHQFEHTPPPLPVASSICPSEPSTARLQTPELPSLSPRLSPPAPLVQPTLVLVLTVSVLLSLLLLAGLWLAIR